MGTLGPKYLIYCSSKRAKIMDPILPIVSILRSWAIILGSFEGPGSHRFVLQDFLQDLIPIRMALYSRFEIRVLEMILQPVPYIQALQFRRQNQGIFVVSLNGLLPRTAANVACF